MQEQTSQWKAEPAQASPSTRDLIARLGTAVDETFGIAVEVVRTADHLLSPIPVGAGEGQKDAPPCGLNDSLGQIISRLESINHSLGINHNRIARGLGIKE